MIMAGVKICGVSDVGGAGADGYGAPDFVSSSPDSVIMSAWEITQALESGKARFRRLREWSMQRCGQRRRR